MPTFRVTGGALTLSSVGSNYPSNELPGVEGPVDPGYGISSDRPALPIVLPPAPPGIWPPPSGGNPIVPVDPDFGFPVTPGTIWPSPGRPPHIDAGFPVTPGHPDAGLPTPPSGTLPARPPLRPDQGLPGGGHIDNTLPSKTYWMLAYCPSLGWKYVSVDPSLKPGMPLPPAAQPK